MQSRFLLTTLGQRYFIIIPICLPVTPASTTTAIIAITTVTVTSAVAEVAEITTQLLSSYNVNVTIAIVTILPLPLLYTTIYNASVVLPLLTPLQLQQQPLLFVVQPYHLPCYTVPPSLTTEAVLSHRFVIVVITIDIITQSSPPAFFRYPFKTGM